ncbi:hypothetical protein DSBG_1305 [Desulfosporosinus sp. BG]|nr:hypothetical protein DSBG_1305 [Desulfosporosinus sp. BG]
MRPIIAKIITQEIGLAQFKVQPIPKAFGTRKLESSLLK